MLETRREFRLSGVPQQTHEPVAQLVNQLTAALLDNLDSVSVVGSALTTDFHPRASDINTVVVLLQDDMAALRAVAALSKTLQKRHAAPPLLMTPAYLERSRDVFGVELLDFQLTHATVLGEDPFTTLTFAREDVRMQCERELKAMLSRLRQGYISAGGHKDHVRGVLLGVVKGLAPLVRALLWMKNLERPSTTEATFRRGSEVFGVDFTHAAALHRSRHEHFGGDPEASFEPLYAAVDELAGVVDALEIV